MSIFGSEAFPFNLNCPEIIPFLLEPVNNSPTAGTTLINFDIILKGTMDPVKFIISDF